MPDFFKMLDASSIVTDTYASVNSLISVTGQSGATSNGVSIFTAIPTSASFIYNPDVFGSTTSGISPSGAFNSIAKTFFNRWSETFYNSASGVYTIPVSHTANVNASLCRVIQISRASLSHGIYPDSLTCVYTFGLSSITAVDNSTDSFGIDKESLSFGVLTDKTNSAHVLGSIFYDYGMIILHGGTGTPASATISASVTGFAFRGSLTGTMSALTSSLTATHIIIENLSYKTYNINARNIYFCRALNSEFNYTSNPSAQNNAFLNASPNNASTWITTIGLYDSRDNLLAVAKVSPPVKKNRSCERVFAVQISL